ncbi:MAG TPA: dihydrofolate reductase [Phycisphaerae bacterium]|nr:dihydrofolate reductase [Phycisphaerae bacterium]HRW54979.1 dihydrofolate reductase [Phycisphaerae bacterium]
MKLTLIAAMNQDRIIGVDGGLPWHIPDDLRFFKRQTSGHAIIMGRKTYDSVGRPLPKRRNIVITRQADFAPGESPATGLNADRTNEVLFANGAGGPNEATHLDVVHSLEAAIDLCRSRHESIAFVIGGAQIYALALPLADEMLITHVDLSDIQGDAHFPEWNTAEWADDGVVDAEFPAARRYIRRR